MAKSKNPNFLITPFCSLNLHVYLRIGNEPERRIYHFIKEKEQEKKSTCQGVYRSFFVSCDNDLAKPSLAKSLFFHMDEFVLII